jgi:hypothetical protein
MQVEKAVYNSESNMLNVKVATTKEEISELLLLALNILAKK